MFTYILTLCPELTRCILLEGISVPIMDDPRPLVGHSLLAAATAQDKKSKVKQSTSVDMPQTTNSIGITSEKSDCHLFLSTFFF